MSSQGAPVDFHNDAYDAYLKVIFDLAPELASPGQKILQAMITNPGAKGTMQALPKGLAGCVCKEHFGGPARYRIVYYFKRGCIPLVAYVSTVQKKDLDYDTMVIPKVIEVVDAYLSGKDDQFTRMDVPLD